jgi:lipid-A-disaccharide synthase-like uncharacterized protein
VSFSFVLLLLEIDDFSSLPSFFWCIGLIGGSVVEIAYFILVILYFELIGTVDL